MEVKFNDVASQWGAIKDVCLSKISSFLESGRYIGHPYIEEFENNFAKYMVKNEIYVTFRYYPLHLIKYYGSWHNQLPNTEWVNDSLTKAEYNGVCNGLDMFVRHFKELRENE